MIEPVFGLAQTASAFDAATLASSYGLWKGMRSNHVIGKNGSFAGVDGSSGSLSTKEDRQLLLAIRAQAELIVVDAATARIEKYRKPSSGAPLAIFSKSGNFSGIPAVESADSDIFLLSKEPPDGADPGSHFVQIGIAQQPFYGFLDWANSLGFNTILLEAGPVLTRYAFEANVVRESAITRTPRSVVSEIESLEHPFAKDAELVSLAISKDASFSLWRH